MQATTQYANGQDVYELSGETLTYFFKTGIVKATGTSINDVMEGKWQFYHESGDLWQVGNFEHGQKEGRWIRYGKDGTIEYDMEFTHGKMQQPVVAVTDVIA